jgi:hypothetical protein
MPSPLQLTAAQTALVKQLTQLSDGTLKARLADALGGGIVDQSGNPIYVPTGSPAARPVPIPQWDTSMTTDEQTSGVQGATIIVAALIAALVDQGWVAPPVTPPVVVNVTYLKDLSGDTGTLTFTNGLLTGST